MLDGGPEPAFEYTGNRAFAPRHLDLGPLTALTRLELRNFASTGLQLVTFEPAVVPGGARVRLAD